MTRLFSLLALAAVLVTVAAPLAAQTSGPRVSVGVRPNLPTDQQPFQLLVQVEGPTLSRVDPPRLPAVSGLRVISGPSTNQVTRFVNGLTSASITFTYTMLADRPGRYEVPSMQVGIDGKRFPTDPLSFTVSRASASASGGAQSDPVILRARLDHESVWVGQPVALDVTVFTRERISGYDWAAVPSFDEFWDERRNVDPDAEGYDTKIGGVDYRAYPLERRTLIPQRAGTFEVSPYVAEFRIRSRARRAFDLFDMGRSRRLQRNTRPLTLEVKQLPANGQPPEFSGAVGRFDISAELDRTDAAVDDAVALRVTVSGEGSLLSTSPPQVQVPLDLEVLDPQLKTSRFAPRGDEFQAEKTWEWILVPTDPGTFQLPEVAFHYFDPEAGEYAVATSDALQLAVERGESRPDRATAIRTLSARPQLHFAKRLEGGLTTRPARVHRQPLFVGLALLPVGLAPVLVIAGRRRARLRRDRGRLRARRARARARKSLAATRRRAVQIESATFHEEVARAMVDYVADRFDRSGSGLTYDTADELLRSRDVDPDVCRRFRACLERCDFARFVPATAEAGRREELLDEALELVDDLEQALR